MVRANQDTSFLFNSFLFLFLNDGQGIWILLRNIVFLAKIDSTPFNLKWLFQVKRMTEYHQLLF